MLHVCHDLYLLLPTDLTSIYTEVLFNTIFSESISPEVIFLHPPEQLIIEVSVRGRYSRIVWHRNGTDAPQSSLSNFNEIYVVQETSSADFGHYQVIPFASPPTIQVVRPPVLDFVVTSPGLCVKDAMSIVNIPAVL